MITEEERKKERKNTKGPKTIKTQSFHLSFVFSSQQKGGDWYYDKRKGKIKLRMKIKTTNYEETIKS